MTKKQKIWFAIFLAMFAIPEVLWGGVFGLWSIDKNIFSIANRNILIFVVLIQFVGSSMFAIEILKIKKTKKYFF
jgi:hypothetical protein